jgi:hypothetical protein
MAGSGTSGEVTVAVMFFVVIIRGHLKKGGLL